MVIIVYSQGFSLLIMPISIMQWRVEIGMFNPTHKIRFINLKPLRVVGLSSDFRLGIRFVFVFLMLLNSIAAHNFAIIDLLQAYNTIHQYDMFCLSESYLDASVSSDNDNLNINGYKLIRADHPGNIKRGGGVCVYFKESLPVRCLPNSYLKEYLILEVSINNKRDYVVSLYRSPSQTSDEFDSFITNLENLVVDISRSNPHFLLSIGDFNAKSSNWSSNDTATAEGAQLDYFTSLYGMKQVLTKPKHILESSASCIDLIFTNHPNTVMDSGVHLSPNLKIEYPPSYIRKNWDYNRSGTD